MFSVELIEQAKQIYPQWEGLHRAMSDGSPQVIAMLSETDMSLDSEEIRRYADAGRTDRILAACDRVDARKQLLRDCQKARTDRIMSKA